MQKTSQVIEFAGKEIKFDIGTLAPQATSSVLARLGETVVLVTVVAGNARDDIDYFPLSVEYAEKLYAGGRIKGSRWVKREGRPTDEAVLIGRLIDRSIRPLFPKEYKNEVQVVVTLLSADGEHKPDILALNAVSLALAISPIPWKGPIGAIRMGLDEAGEYIFNPVGSEMKVSKLDIVASQSKDLTVMIEAGALEVPENVVHNSIVEAHKETQKMVAFIEKVTKEIGQAKIEVAKDPLVADAIAFVEKSYSAEVEALIEASANKEGGGSETVELLAKIVEAAKSADSETSLDKKILGKALEAVMFKIIRSNLIEKKVRADGRKIDQIRDISMELGLLPRTHGSAVFNRGLTQALSIVTLGSPRMEQLLESAEGEESKRYIHHYSGPPYSFGQAGRFGSVSRRETGHGALAERALEAVIPTKAAFPYTIRVVSEVLSQNGSSSMASTCGSTLALMDAGVPITKPVAGISVGMMSNEKDYVLITDIIGIEDFSGDMDFKVAGTDTGITAIQLDVKVPGLTDKQVGEILDRAQSARMIILEKMNNAIAAPRAELSKYAPKIEVVTIPVEKIGELIGPGGKTIKNIIATTGATVDVEDDGSVTISGTDSEAVNKAIEWVKGLTREVMVGEVFDGPVKRILPFGAFVEILPGKEGMVHVSKMGEGFVNSPEDVVSLGEVVKVRVQEIDDQGRINLTMKFGESGESTDSGSGQPPREPRSGGYERRPSSSSSRPPFERRSASPRPAYGAPASRPAPAPFRRDFNRVEAPAADAAETKHPLSRQFERERVEKRPAGSSPRRRTHY
ncbi:MAG: polyribonucleotide nucleotidyltransferase [Candidatus Levybacteria bacterium]|nr:polyribonucleotide nucleotidyltransferase [Candidatus Levybacteria bacterium]